MPERDGIETLKNIRKDATTDCLNTILLTAHDSKETKLRAFNKGFDHFLSKVASETQINYTYGHLVADKVPKAVAACLKASNARG